MAEMTMVSKTIRIPVLIMENGGSPAHTALMMNDAVTMAKRNLFFLLGGMMIAKNIP